MKLFYLLIWSLLSGLFLHNGYAAGLLTPKDKHLPELEIRAHHVDVAINDGYALTTVTQVFNNPHDQDLEAIYRFPLPDGAVVAELTLWIDGKPVIGEVLEKKRTKRIYEAQRAQGRDAGMMEKNSYKTFDTAVSPVRAKSQTRVRIAYYQWLKVDHAIGRYVYPLEDGGVDDAALQFWSTNDRVKTQFSFQLSLRSSSPVEAVRLPAHPQAQIQQIADKEWRVSLDSQTRHNTHDPEATALADEYNEAQPTPSSTLNVARLNKDMVVYWKHKSGLPASVDLMAYKPEGKKKGTFMLTFTPGEELKTINTGKDWIFVLDRSGSMKGKYRSLLDGVAQALMKLRHQDRYRVILFGSSVQELTQGFTPVDEIQVKQTIEALKATRPGSSTNLYAALQSATQSLDADRPSGLVLVTDGVANVGRTEKEAFIELLNRVDVRLFTFIMGNSANKPLLKGLAKHSGGFAMNVSNSDDIVGHVVKAASKITHHAMHDLSLVMNGADISGITPARLPSLYRGEQLVVMGHYRGAGDVPLRLSATINGEKREFKTVITLPESATEHPELERLWAFATVQDLKQTMTDFNHQDYRQAVTDIALEYSLVTDYTSMLVVAEEVKQQHRLGDRNKQRVAREKQARQQRKTTVPVSKRADQQQPMFSGSRASGGGSLGAWVGGFLLIFLLFGRRKW